MTSMRRVASVLLAGVLLGAVVGALLGWASRPAAPEIRDDPWMMQGNGQHPSIQRAVDRYTDVLLQFIFRGTLLGGAFGGVAAVGGLLLTSATGRQQRGIR